MRNGGEVDIIEKIKRGIVWMGNEVEEVNERE